MKKSQLFGLMLALAVAMSFCTLVCAQEPAAAEDAPTAAEIAMNNAVREQLDDPAFRQYVDITLLQPAWVAKDADLLTDIGLQLAQGEKVLLRSHKAGSAQDMLKLAASIATRKSDKEAIARIEKAAKANNFADVAGEASQAAKLAATPRKADPALMVSLEQTNPADVAAFGLLIDGVHSAEILRDKAWLDEVDQKVGQYNNLTDSQKNYIKKILGEARSTISDKPIGNSVTSTIVKLDSVSRHHHHSHWGHHHDDHHDDHHDWGGHGWGGHWGGHHGGGHHGGHHGGGHGH